MKTVRTAVAVTILALLLVLAVAAAIRPFLPWLFALFVVDSILGAAIRGQ